MEDIPPRQQVNGSETIRMGQTEGLPHYRDPDAPRYNTSGEQGYHYGAVARRTTEGGDPAYAVLKAFQDFMENERQRAQRRTTTTAIVFAALLAVVVIGFMVLWIMTMGRIQDSQSDLMRTALAAREARQPAQPAFNAADAVAAAVAEAEGKAAARAAEEKAARDAMTKADEERRAEAERELEARLAAERAKAAEEAAARDAATAKAIQSLKETIEAVQRDNASLRKDNDALRKVVARGDSAKPPAQPAPAVQQPKPPAQKPPAARPDSPSPPIGKVGKIAPQITVKRPAPPKGYSQETISVPVGENGDGQVRWHILLPSEIPAQ